MNKKIVSYFLRLMGITIVGIITLSILNIIFAFNGNPYKARDSERILKKYITKSYSKSDYVLSNIQYNFKSNTYYIYMQNKAIYDDKFNVYYDYDNKKIIDTEYTDLVESRMQTKQRLENQYRDKIFDTFSNLLPPNQLAKIKRIKIDIEANKGYTIKDLKLDTTIDEIDDYKIKLTLIINRDFKTKYEVAKHIRILNTILNNSGIYVDEYKFIYNTLLDAVIIDTVTANDIKDYNFEKYLKKFLQKQERFN